MQANATTKPLVSEYTKAARAVHVRILSALRHGLKHLSADDLVQLQARFTARIWVELESREEEVRRRPKPRLRLVSEQPQDGENLKATRAHLMRTMQARADQLRGNGAARPK